MIKGVYHSCGSRNPYRFVDVLEERYGRPKDARRGCAKEGAHHKSARSRFGRPKDARRGCAKEGAHQILNAQLDADKAGTGCTGAEKARAFEVFKCRNRNLIGFLAQQAETFIVCIKQVGDTGKQ